MKMYTIPLLIVALLAVVSQQSIAQQSQGLFTFEKSNNAGAKVDIYPKDKAKNPISRYLYAKFAEHLVRDVYGGAWAQILDNPGFEGWKYFMGREYSWIGQRYGQYAKLAGMSEAKVKGSTDRNVTPWWFDRNLAPWWLAYGSGDVVYKLDTDSFNSELAQKITVNSLKSKQAGIFQAIYLPLHREQNYTLSFYARSIRPLKLNIAIHKISEGKYVLAEGDVKVGTKDWKRYVLKLKVRKRVKNGTLLMLTIGLLEPGTVWLDQMALFPDDNVKGFDADVVRLTRKSRLSMLRFPGGNFVSGYHWKDGVGPRDKRPTRMNRPWDMIESNQVGTDEWMAFCKAVGAEPLIVVNAGNGTPEEAAEWVQYCNGGVDTKYGALRAKNGHPKPYNVVYWELGNELWGRWQIGFTTPEKYAERYRKFYEAMTAVDPNIKTIANGQSLKWNAPLIQKDSDILRSLSLHTLVGGGTSQYLNPTDIFKSLMAFTFSYADELRALGAQMAKRVKDPKLAITELQIFTNKPSLPNNQTLSEALFYSGILNTSIRLDGLVEIITHSALVNHAGGLVKSREIVYPNPVYFARTIYSLQSGTIPVRINVDSPMYTSSGRYSPITEVPYLDAIAMVSNDNDELNLILTNRNPQKTLSTRVVLHDFNPAKKVRIKMLTGKSYMARNGWENPTKVKLRDSSLRIKGKELKYSVPANSIVLLTFTRK